MGKTSSMIVAGVLLLAGLTAVVALGASYAPQGAATVQAPVAQGWTGQPYGGGGMMGGGLGMMGGRGMMGYISSGTPYATPGNRTGWSVNGMLARCGAFMRSLWGDQTQTHQSNQIAIAGYGFAPQVVTVKAGTTLTWTNYDSVSHSVNSGTPANPTGLFDSGDLAQGGRFSYAFALAGTYAYYCDLHAGMAGVVIVEP